MTAALPSASRRDRILETLQRRLPWLIAGACVFVALVVVLNVVLQTGYPKRPEEVASRFVTAGTCAAGGKYAVPGYLQRCDDDTLVPLSDVVVVSADVAEKQASVVLMGDVRGETVQETARLLRQDGKWKVWRTRIADA